MQQPNTLTFELAHTQLWLVVLLKYLMEYFIHFTLSFALPRVENSISCGTQLYKVPNVV